MTKIKDPRKNKYSLTKGIQQHSSSYIEENDSKRYRELHHQIDHYSEEYLRAKEDGFNTESVVYNFYEMIEGYKAKDALNLAPEHATSCFKGCSHCCKQNVAMSEDEAELLILHAEETKININWNTVKKQAKINPDKWFDQNNELRSCVFLNKDGTCKVYKFRPGICRLYTVFTDPKFCNVKKYLGHKVGQSISYRAEIILCGMWNVFDEIGNMPNMLLKALENRKKNEKNRKS